MSNRMHYEWDIETLEYGTEEVLEHDHADRLNSFSAHQVEAALSGGRCDEEVGTCLVLVRDQLEVDGTDLAFRLWAYVQDGQLPEFFSNSLGCPTGYRVPARFHRELRARLETMRGGVR